MKFKENIYACNGIIARLNKLHEKQSEIIKLENDQVKASLQIVDDHLVKSSSDLTNIIGMINNGINENRINLEFVYLTVFVENALSCAKHLQQDHELSGMAQKMFGEVRGEIKVVYKNLKKLHDPIY